MAEAFAAAASGAGLASLGIQIMGGVIELRDLCSRIRGAPMEIQQLLSELNLLANILEEYESIASAKAEGASAASNALRNAMNSCS